LAATEENWPSQRDLSKLKCYKKEVQGNFINILYTSE
jgi:hypothetical protein